MNFGSLDRGEILEKEQGSTGDGERFLLPYIDNKSTFPSTKKTSPL